MAPIATSDLTQAAAARSPPHESVKLCRQVVQPVDIDEPHVFRFTEADITEIEQAASNFQASCANLNQLSPQTFPLPILSQKLLRIKSEVYGGDGYVLLRGLDSRNYCPLKNAIIFTGLTSYIGGRRAMTGHGDGSKSVLQHVTAVTPDEKKCVHRLANQSKSIPMHTDRGDIVALYSLSTGLSGGSFHLASIDQVFPNLSSDAVRSELTQPWTQIDPAAGNGSVIRPLVFPRKSPCSPSSLSVNFTYAFLTGTQSRPRPSHLPPLTNDQLNAIEDLQQKAREHALSIDFHPGDLVWFDNLRIMHARDSFVDDVSQGRKRHLMRLIVKFDPILDGRRIPEELQEMNKGLFGHAAEEEELDIKPELFTFAMGP